MRAPAPPADPPPAPRLRQRPFAVIFDMDGLMLDTEAAGAADVARRGRCRRRPV